MGFSQALSGLNAAASSLDVQGNNIANSQTVGFKSSSAQFADVFANSRIGLGTRMSTVLQDFGEGNLESTGRALDLGISGEGFFRFSQNDQVVYSRNGQLSMTADGFLQNAQGARIMGYGVNANGEVQTGGQPQVIEVGSEEMEASATTQVSTVMNLDSREVSGEGLDQVQVVTDMSRPNDPEAQESLGYHFSNNFTVFDSLGNPRNVTVYYEKRSEGENSWLGRVVMDGNYSMISDQEAEVSQTLASTAKNALSSLAEASGDLESFFGEVESFHADNSASSYEDLKDYYDSEYGSKSLSEAIKEYLNGGGDGSASEALYVAFLDAGDYDDAPGVSFEDNFENAVNEVYGEIEKQLKAGGLQRLGDVSENFFSEIDDKLTGNPDLTSVGNAKGFVSGSVAGDSPELGSGVNTSTELFNSLKGYLEGVVDDYPVYKEEIEAVTAEDINAMVGVAGNLKESAAFDPYGANDFVVEFDSNGQVSRVGQVDPANGQVGPEFVDVESRRPTISFASDETTPLGGAPEDMTFTMDLAGTTQFGNTSRTTDLQQNGYTSGAFVGISIEDDGTVMRNYSNEQSLAAGQIAMANFRNPEGLRPEGDNAWSATQASGQELVGAPGTGLLGSIESGAIEASNVDMARELVDMIVTQRAYQANSQTIKTQDEVLQTAINLR